MRVPLLPLLLLPSLASAQVLTTLQVSFPNIPTGATQRFVTNACDATVQMQYVVSNATVACQDLEIWASTQSCGDTPGTSPVLKTVSLADLRAQPAGTPVAFNVDVSKLPFSATDGGACGSTPVEQDFNICSAMKTLNSLGQCDQVVRGTSPIPVIRFDTLPPAAPGAPEVTPLDSGLRVSVPAAGEDVEQFVLQYAPAGSGAFVDGPTILSSPGTGDITGLTNGQAYEVRAFSVDGAGNRSAEPSPVATGTPVQTVGFYGAYKAAGGQEAGGCAAAGAALAPLGALAVVFLRRRRS